MSECNCPPKRIRRWTVYRIHWPEYLGTFWEADPERGRLDFTHGEDNGRRSFTTHGNAFAYADAMARNEAGTL